MLFLFVVSSLPISAKTFEIRGFKNASQLIWDDNFKLHINEFFGSKSKQYFWANEKISDQVKAGFSGAPDQVKALGSNAYIVSACRHQSCDEKSAYITNGDLELFAIIAYHCENNSGEIEFCSDGQLVIFYKNVSAKDLLSNHLINWKDDHAPKAAVVFENIN
ncbi:MULTISPECIES: hypothetical protein [Pseudoalteromonas]|uniref:hypothetical protein n=1 Tax=Pseudoalteromonas TaxID=53246 RepID=UPI0012BD0D59|nr:MULTISPECIES: hypothetical protein [Pseudoalteromonas]MCG7547496.1 hypothetical protein [Pseudoalteromonas sp. Of7M-16]